MVFYTDPYINLVNCLKAHRWSFFYLIHVIQFGLQYKIVDSWESPKYQILCFAQNH
jgi:hypothetical protein